MAKEPPELVPRLWQGMLSRPDHERRGWATGLRGSGEAPPSVKGPGLGGVRAFSAAEGSG